VPRSIVDIVERYLAPYGGARSVEATEEATEVGGKRWWRAKVVVKGLQSAACEELGRYLARSLGAELRSTPVFVSPRESEPSSCWIELSRIEPSRKINW